MEEEGEREEEEGRGRGGRDRIPADLKAGVLFCMWIPHLLLRTYAKCACIPHEAAVAASSPSGQSAALHDGDRCTGPGQLQRR